MDENTPTRSVVSGRQSKIKKPSIKHIVIMAVSAVAFVLVILMGLLWYQSTMGANIDGSKYQAVFFTNGQVYFGKLQTLNGNYMKLTDIYYLQTETASSDIQKASSKSSADVTLVKLGNEIHGPVDEMVISKDQILFFENLKSDGKVAQSITEYKKR